MAGLSVINGMPLFLITFILSMLAPRLAIVLLWLLTEWFKGVFPGLLWPVLGFFFMPYTLLWYALVQHSPTGTWGPVQIFVLIMAILTDFSASGFGYTEYHHHIHVTGDGDEHA